MQTLPSTDWETSLVDGPHTIVVGAGIVGVSTAYYLSRRGRRVTVIEMGDIGNGASSGNAGIVALGHPPIPRPGLIRQVLGWMLNGSSPVYIRPRFDLALFRWMWDLKRACTEEHFCSSMELLTTLGRHTQSCFEQIFSDEQMSCEYHRTGWLEVYRTEKGLAQGRRDAELLERYGFEIQVLDGDEVIRREPAFKDTVVGAVHSVESAFVDPMKFLVELAERARGHGASIRTNTQILDVLTSDGGVVGVRLDTGERLEAESVVLAGGIWTTGLARKLGIHVPMQAGKGYHRDITRPSPCVGIACVLAEDHVAVTPLDDVLRLSGTVEFSGLNHRMVPRRLDMLTAAARHYLDGLALTQPVSEWCGLRPCTADGLPVVGWAPAPRGLFVATGHARMGLTLGPVTGKLVSECILDGRPSIDITPLRVDRFRSRRYPSRPV